MPRQDFWGKANKTCTKHPAPAKLRFSQLVYPHAKIWDSCQKHVGGGSRSHCFVPQVPCPPGLQHGGRPEPKLPSTHTATTTHTFLVIACSLSLIIVSAWS